MGGTAIHLIGFAIPGLEFIISGSVWLFGILLGVKRPPRDWLVLFLAAIVGIFHGYAYGEAIFAAETQPLIAYLFGFACVQLAIGAAAYAVARTVLLNRGEREPSVAPLRPAGLVICGVGLALLSSQVLDALSTMLS